MFSIEFEKKGDIDLDLPAAAISELALLSPQPLSSIPTEMAIVTTTKPAIPLSMVIPMLVAVPGVQEPTSVRVVITIRLH